MTDTTDPYFLRNVDVDNLDLSELGKDYSEEELAQAKAAIALAKSKQIESFNALPFTDRAKYHIGDVQKYIEDNPELIGGAVPAALAAYGAIDLTKKGVGKAKEVGGKIHGSLKDMMAESVQQGIDASKAEVPQLNEQQVQEKLTKAPDVANPIVETPVETLGQVASSEQAATEKKITKATNKEAKVVAQQTAVVPWTRDAQGNIKYPEGMTDAAKAGHKAFNQQFPTAAAELEAKGQFGILGGGAGDNNLFNAYGKDISKTIRNDLIQGQMVGPYVNYKEGLAPAINALPKDQGLGQKLAELRVNEPHGATHGPLGVPAAVSAEGKVITRKVPDLLKGGAASALLMAIANAANASTQQTSPSKAVKPPENKEGAFVGYPQLQRQSASMRKAAEGRVPENIKDPATYAFVQGLISGNPESDISVLSEKRKKASDAAYYGAQLSNLMQMFGR